MSFTSHKKLLCKGSSPIELMVAIFIFAFGLLGLASLQVNALKLQKTTHLRSAATQAAYDMSDRMRANIAGVKDGKYIYTKEYGTSSTASHEPPECSSAVCRPDEVAVIDREQWLDNISQILPGGSGFISGDTLNGFNLIVMWKEPALNTAASDSACPPAQSLPNPNAPADVQCFSVNFRP